MLCHWARHSTTIGAEAVLPPQLHSASCAELRLNSQHQYRSQSTCFACTLQVGVTVPNSKPDWSSAPEVQRVTVRHNLFGQQRLLTLLSPAGNDSVINITLTAADAAALSHPNLGLNVSVNGSSLPALVAVAGGQQGANTLASMLRQALRLSSSALGVEWSAAEDGRSITYQVAAAGSTSINLVRLWPARNACSTAFMSEDMSCPCRTQAPLWF